jgi:hypothetical protein
VGAGTRFIFNLPLAPSAAEAEPGTLRHDLQTT